jgi:hypothetical protein
MDDRRVSRRARRVERLDGSQYHARIEGRSAMNLLERVLGALEDERDRPLTVSQHNFLRLHVKHAVEMWKWHFCSTQLRASAGKRRATIWVDELHDLVARGLVTRGPGETVYATTDGKALFS